MVRNPKDAGIPRANFRSRFFQILLIASLLVSPSAILPVRAEEPLILREPAVTGRLDLFPFVAQPSAYESFPRLGASMSARIRDVDALAISTNKVSRRARREAVRVARSRKIPLVLHHSWGVCTFRCFLYCLEDQLGGAGNA